MGCHYGSSGNNGLKLQGDATISRYQDCYLGRRDAAAPTLARHNFPLLELLCE